MIAANDINQLKNHLTLTSASDINSIVMPILGQHGITYFNFYKEYTDGTVIRLSNHPEWAHHYYAREYITRTTNMPIYYLKKKVNYAIWNPNEWLDEVLIDAAQNFNIGNGISIIKIYADSIESYGFGSHIDNHRIINNFYLTNLEWLENFCVYFKEAAATLIEQCELNKIILPNYFDKTNIISLHREPASISLQLSQQQLLCSQLLLRGMTNKQIARQLNLSPRTVEYYFNIIKAKLNCDNKIELIVKLSNLKIVKDDKSAI